MNRRQFFNWIGRAAAAIGLGAWVGTEPELGVYIAGRSSERYATIGKAIGAAQAGDTVVVDDSRGLSANDNVMTWACSANDGPEISCRFDPAQDIASMVTVEPGSDYYSLSYYVVIDGERRNVTMYKDGRVYVNRELQK